MLEHNHPAYPSRRQLAAEARAEARDERDAERLSWCAGALTAALDTMAVVGPHLEHPDAEWHPGELIDVLCAQLTAVQHELARLTGPVVLDE